VVRRRRGISRAVGATRALAALLAGSVAVSGCQGDEILAPMSEEPFLYLVLNERSVDRSSVEGQVGQHALLLTTGVATEPPHYRLAERFEMRRASDGTSFAWRSQRTPHGEVGSYPGVALDFWNFHLPDTAAVGLGAEDLQPGGTYELWIETQGEVIRGRATIPAEFTASVVERGDGRRIAVWPRVSGAAGYRVELSNGDVLVQSDTSYVIPGEVLKGGAIEIDALDPNLFRYLAEGQTARAGIDDGYGVFGAITTVRLEF
jgi:hypothetical protein